mmetsp:Transcript_35651/g.101470  ORF Transcript_35651/g.101470 Transcript_35651/m.101470 type:complete len:268 (+) Transcript_35651:356-1159(+)
MRRTLWPRETACKRMAASCQRRSMTRVQWARTKACNRGSAAKPGSERVASSGSAGSNRSSMRSQREEVASKFEASAEAAPKRKSRRNHRRPIPPRQLRFAAMKDKHNLSVITRPTRYKSTRRSDGQLVGRASSAISACNADANPETTSRKVSSRSPRSCRIAAHAPSSSGISQRLSFNKPWPAADKSVSGAERGKEGKLPKVSSRTPRFASRLYRQARASASTSSWEGAYRGKCSNNKSSNVPGFRSKSGLDQKLVANRVTRLHDRN